MRCFSILLFNDDCILLNIWLKNIYSLSVVLTKECIIGERKTFFLSIKGHFKP